MRDIKFRAWDTYTNEMYLWGDLGQKDSDGHLSLWNTLIGEVDHCVPMQYTGLKDKNGVEIYEGDILNICYTSNYGEHVHDGLYKVEKGFFGGIVFKFIKLMWESFGYNQYPSVVNLSEKHGYLNSVYANGRYFLTCDIDNYTPNPENYYPFNDEKELSFSSRYFKIVGNIHENPELIKTPDSNNKSI